VDQLLEDKAVPCGPINDIGQAFADEQVKARNVEVKQAVAGINTAQSAIKIISAVAGPMRLSATPRVLRRAPPALREHTDEVLVRLNRTISGLYRPR
jgi:crotonobetainyl-CoA:carnitine CoA-transferase CaiB-like acyl-CoA transferase